MASQDRQKTVQYLFRFDGEDDPIAFVVDVARTGSRADPSATTLPWTALDHHKCKNCPLSSTQHRHCPAALDVADVLHTFNAHKSYDRVHVDVLTEERSVSADCDVQTGVQSLLGLVMATSGCPILGQMRSLAYYHLPFATTDETLYRTAANYLLRQFFIHRAGEKADLDLDGLRAFYEDLQTVNENFIERLRAGAEMDANLNAVVLWFTVSALVSSSLDADLENLRPLFYNDAAD